MQFNSTELVMLQDRWLGDKTGEYSVTVQVIVQKEKLCTITFLYTYPDKYGVNGSLTNVLWITHIHIKLGTQTPE